MFFHGDHPTKLIFEEGALDCKGSLLQSLGDRVLNVTGKTGAAASGALADVLQALDSNDQAFRIFDGISANPTVSSVRQAAAAARAFEADFIVAVGGGSVMDAAKAAALLAGSNLTNRQHFEPDESCTPLPVVAVGITAGTGSEVTDIAVLTIEETGRKQRLSCKKLYPSIAFSDWRYTESLPERITVSAGLDALCHLLESWFSPEFDSRAERDCLSGAALALRQLSRLEDRPHAWSDREFRRKMSEASLFGGYAIDRCHTSFPHLAGYALTEEAGLPHGLACAVFLPVLMDLAAEYAPERCEILKQATDFSVQQIAELADYLVQEDYFAHPFRFPPEQLEKQLPRYEQSAHRMRTPGQLSGEELLQLADDRLALLFSE